MEPHKNAEANPASTSFARRRLTAQGEVATMRHRGWIAFSPALLLALFLTPVAVPADTTTPEPKNPRAHQGEWPRKIRMGEITVSLDEPQADSLEGTKLKAHGGARIQKEGDTEPAYASIWYEAEVEINRAARTVTMVSVNVTRVQLPGAPPARQQRLATRLGQVFTHQQLQLPLDDVLASVKIASRRDAGPPKLNTDPPKILFA